MQATVDERLASVAMALDRDGFAVIAGAVEAQLIDRVRSIAPEVPGGGLRNLLQVAPAFGELARHASIRALVGALVGRDAFVTRAILFDKSPGANWSLGFHQDVVIAVANRVDVPGFGPWSVKDGVQHVRPSADVLARMVTVRIHLDACPADNGALEVIPGSHRHGFLGPDAERWIRSWTPTVCEAHAGDAVLMRPLILHASRRSVRPAHRRVAHFEFACDALPGGLEWAAV